MEKINGNLGHNRLEENTHLIRLPSSRHSPAQLHAIIECWFIDRYRFVFVSPNTKHRNWTSSCMSYVHTATRPQDDRISIKRATLKKTSSKQSRDTADWISRILCKHNIKTACKHQTRGIIDEKSQFGRDLYEHTF